MAEAELTYYRIQVTMGRLQSTSHFKDNGTLGFFLMGRPDQQQDKLSSTKQVHLYLELLCVLMLRDLKDAFWPFQLDRTKSPFLRAARAANCSESTNDTEESAFELASVKAALHRLERGVWTSVRFGDMRRALSGTI